MTKRKKNSVFTSIGGDKSNSMGDLLKGTYEKWDKIERKQRKRSRHVSNNEVKTINIKDLKPKRTIRKKRKKPKVKSKEKYKKREGRSEGDQMIYYLLHSVISSFLFIMLAIYLNFFRLKSDTMNFIFSVDFLMTILAIFIVSIITNFFGRIVAYLVLQLIYRRTATKTFLELNSTGLNKLGIRYLVATLIASLLFTTGMVYILQLKIFGEDTIVSLILTYILIKIFIFILTKFLIGVKG